MTLQELRKRRRILSDEAIEGEVFSKIVETWFRDDRNRVFAVCTAVHRQDFDRRIGGVRIVREDYPESLREVGDLAHAMTWKTALCGLPADGEKTIVYCHGNVPKTIEDKAAVVAEHLRVLREVDPGVVFGPDMDCDERVMDALAHDHGMSENVSGLTEGRGGFSIDEHGFTARGLDAAMTAAAELLGWNLERMTMVVQGFGAVGAHTARLLARNGVKIVAVSNKHGAIFAAEGLPVEKLFDIWKTAKDEGFRDVIENPPPGITRLESTDHLFGVKADIFVPAARTDVLKMPDELNDSLSAASMDVTEFWDQSGTSVVLEGANHPLSDRAEEYLMDQGVYVLPDYLVNCGGLIGCWMDWCYREQLLEADEEQVHLLRSKALAYIQNTVAQNVVTILQHTARKSAGLRRFTNDLARNQRSRVIQEFLAVSSLRTPAGGREVARSLVDKHFERSESD